MDSLFRSICSIRYSQYIFKSLLFFFSAPVKYELMLFKNNWVERRPCLVGDFFSSSFIQVTLLLDYVINFRIACSYELIK